MRRFPLRLAAGAELSVPRRGLHAPIIHETLARAAEATAESLCSAGKLLVAGNGGSAADAQHLVAEFVGRLTVNRPALRAVALTTDTSILTALGNDFGFETIFARQIEALGAPGDVFLGISTSGRSPNIVAACRAARETGLAVIGFTGAGGGAMNELCDALVRVWLYG